jgi:TolB protein
MLIAEPTEGDVPLKVRLDGSRSYARKGCLKEYRWDPDGDGDIDFTTLYSWIEYVYENPGTYNASLVVVDNGGRISNKALEKIVVNEEIVSLGEIAFWSNRDVPEGGYNEEIYSGEIILRIKDNKIELVNTKRLTTDSGQDLEPSWSPDGLEILFTSHRTGGTAVWRMNADGSNQRDITSNIVERARQADWGVNGKIVVAYRDLGDTIAGIGAIDSNTNFFTPIYLESISGRISGWPKWSPDCSKIAFQKYINGNWEIFLMNSDGSDLENLTNDFATDQQPAWSPDGRILFWSDRANPNQTPIEADLYLMNSDGSNLIRLTSASGRELDPAISPDGKYISFTRFRFFLDPSQLYLTELINAGDINKWIQLTKEGASGYPTWRPQINN